jgi:nitrite reductase/ring-hydroxylating ferredoxin subunit
MPLHKVAKLSSLPPGAMIEAAIGGHSYAICHTVDGRVYAIDGTCPHRGGPLAHGALHGGTVACPWHAWEFDCATGEHDYNPSIRLDTFAVRVDGDDILVDLP